MQLLNNRPTAISIKSSISLTSATLKSPCVTIIMRKATLPRSFTDMINDGCANYHILRVRTISVLILIRLLKFTQCLTIPSSKQDPVQITVDADNCPLLRELNTAISHYFGVSRFHKYLYGRIFIVIQIIAPCHTCLMYLDLFHKWLPHANNNKLHIQPCQHTIMQ